MYLYIKAIHIIFVVTWFAGLFYTPRLFIYHKEAEEKEGRSILQEQFTLMTRRLWLGITWPSAIITLVLGTWIGLLYGNLHQWLIIKICFVAGLYGYHIFLNNIYRQQIKGSIRMSSMKLRMWNEVATVFLVAIVLLATVKNSVSLVWGLAGLLILIIALLVAIRIYKKLRS